MTTISPENGWRGCSAGFLVHIETSFCRADVMTSGNVRSKQARSLVRVSGKTPVWHCLIGRAQLILLAVASVITGQKIFSRSGMIAGMVAIGAVFDGWIMFCNSAQSVEVPLPTVEVYNLEGTLLYSPEPDLDNAAPRGSAQLKAVNEALQAMATRHGAREQRNVRALITREFEQYDPAYLAHKAVREKHLDALKLKLSSREKKGKTFACSRRMIIEAEWLLNYTAEWPKLDQQLEAIEHSLATKDQGFALRQTPDGSWGACYRAWFEKIDGIADFLGDLRAPGDGRPPRLKYPFEVLQKINSSQVLIPYLYRLQISQIAKTGIYERKELNALEGALSQVLFKEKLRTLLQANGAPFIDQPYVDAYRRFLDDTQDPILGYWGPWIMSGREIIRAADLSQTYHIIAYRKGAVNHWPQIIETTLAIKDVAYPFGWRHNGQYSNHNNYDVVRILRLGWPYMTPEEIDQARTEIRAMINWTLRDSIRPDGEFREDPGVSDSVDEAYYYGVSFLVEADYWNAERRFWDDDATRYAGADDLCRKIRGHLVKLQTNSITAQHALSRLNESCRVGNPQ